MHYSAHGVTGRCLLGDLLSFGNPSATRRHFGTMQLAFVYDAVAAAMHPCGLGMDIGAVPALLPEPRSIPPFTFAVDKRGERHHY
jgi:hypothetical protein